MVEDNNTPFFSIAIPTYEMKGYGDEFLSFSFGKLYKQSFKDFEVVVSDHSRNNEIKELCERWSNMLNIKHLKNDFKVGGSSPNINNAIKNSEGKWIKLLWQDDFLFNNESLEITKKYIENNNDSVWFASACEHTNDGFSLYRPFYPKWSDDIQFGNNTISSPSVITIKNDNNKFYFDEDLIWLMDVEYYKRMYDTYGEPTYINEITVVNRTWNESVSNSLSKDIKNNEVNLMKKRYHDSIK